MERMLRNLFDFQKFREHPRLAAMLADAESRCSFVSDDALELVSAAGELYSENPIDWKESDDD